MAKYKKRKERIYKVYTVETTYSLFPSSFLYNLNYQYNRHYNYDYSLAK